MPRRRRLAGLAHGLAGGVQDISSMLLRQQFQEEQQKRLMESIFGRQIANQIASLGPEDVEKSGPEAVGAQAEALKALLPKEMQATFQMPNFGSMERPRDARLSEVLEEISEAKTPEEVKSPAVIRGMVSRRRLPTDAIPSASLFHDDVTVTRGPTRTGPSAEMDTALQEAERLANALSTEREVGPERAARGQARGTALGQEEAASQTFPAQLSREMQKYEAMTPLEAARTGAVGQAEQDVENNPQNQRARARGAGMEAGARRQAELAQELSQMGITGQQQQAALSLADDFTQQSREFTAVRSAYQNIARLANVDSAAGDLGLIFSFMKSLDPASTVREGEFANAQNAAGIPDRIRNQYNRVMSGERLTKEQRTDFVRTARTLYNSAQEDQKELVQTFTDRARQMRVPPSLVVREPTEVPDYAGEYLSNDPNAGRPLP